MESLPSKEFSKGNSATPTEEATIKQIKRLSIYLQNDHLGALKGEAEMIQEALQIERTELRMEHSVETAAALLESIQQDANHKITTMKQILSSQGKEDYFASIQLQSAIQAELVRQAEMHLLLPEMTSAVVLEVSDGLV
ncbi:hypothetical protein VKT23_020689 [Stygiomarasmius scandens]|uniref:Uncharacterized protein n=1 Tax=Marasmiellus scandens TaxID=2682957 RepID=A0ABR1IIJ6_9AGAR